MLENKNVLVTGGTGMVGRELVQLLLKRGAKVRVASLDEPIDFFDEVEFHKVDLTIYENCEQVCNGMDYVFHVAGIKGSAKMSTTQPLDYFIPMIRFNTNMMEAAFRANVDWYLYTSSVGVYSPADIMNENDVWSSFPSKNDRLPGWAKRMGELQAEGYKVQHDWDNISIVRPANVYGKWDNFDLENSMVIPSLIRKAHENDELAVLGDGSPIRDFIHARDVARGMIFAVENKISDPVNLGSGVGLTIRDLAVEIAEYFNTTITFGGGHGDSTVDGNSLGDAIRLLNTERIKSYGFEPEVSIKEGIVETAEWYVNNLDKLNYRYNSFKK